MFRAKISGSRRRRLFQSRNRLLNFISEKIFLMPRWLISSIYLRTVARSIVYWFLSVGDDDDDDEFGLVFLSTVSLVSWELVFDTVWLCFDTVRLGFRLFKSVVGAKTLQANGSGSSSFLSPMIGFIWCSQQFFFTLFEPMRSDPCKDKAELKEPQLLFHRPMRI